MARSTNRIVRECLGAIAAILALSLAGPALAQGESGIEPGGSAAADLLVPCVFEGSVSTPEGAPAEGALVVTSAGGQAVVDLNGRYVLETGLPIEVQRVQVTAIGHGSQKLTASVSVAVHALGSVLVEPLSLSEGTTCSPSWLPTFGEYPGVSPGVATMAVFDDGGGPALYVGGSLYTAGGGPAAGLAKWDGSSWMAIGGLDGRVDALTVHDDGRGPALFVGGYFVHAGGMVVQNIARWDGSSWTSLASGVAAPNNGGQVDALAVFDDGGGPALFVGGGFTVADNLGPGGGVAVNSVAKWDGSIWTSPGSGVAIGPETGSVRALAVHDEGGGPALYAGGVFTSAGGVAAANIAKWDGTTWTPLGGGIGNGSVQTLAVYDDGGGSALYAGGNFSAPVAENRIAKWDGSDWTALGGGLSGIVRALAVYDAGNGPVLVAGGDFDSLVGENYTRKWDGASWSAVGVDVDAPVHALAVHDAGAGPELYIGGEFWFAGEMPAYRMVRWDGSNSAALGSGVNGGVVALTLFDDGSGPGLYAGGGFTSVSGVPANRVARWDGSTWAALGEGMNDYVAALAVYDDGRGPALYVAGAFSTAGGVGAGPVARWDGSTWEPVGGGVGFLVNALAIYDDGRGPALYAGGGLFTTGGVARWDGSSWEPVGSGMNATVDVLATHDDGGGPALYAGGSFWTAGGVPANRVARWDGSSWSGLGGGPGLTTGSVKALVTYDDGSGSALYAGGGQFHLPGALEKWDGSSWSPVWNGTGAVEALRVYDDGNGEALYAGGYFDVLDGVAAQRIAKWNGSTWAPLGGGMYAGAVLALMEYDGGGQALYAGGGFWFANDSGDSFLARWGCPPDTIPPTLECPGLVFVRDQAGPGEVVTFAVAATDDQDPEPTVVCLPPSGSFFPRGVTLVTCTATDATGNEATCRFRVIVQPAPGPPNVGAGPKGGPGQLKGGG